MSAAFDFDNAVTAHPPLSSVQADDPFARLFFDRTTTQGLRLLAVAEPVDRKPQGFLTAAIAIAAFEEALAVAVVHGAESGLRRAFLAANDAVRSANKRTMASQRSFAGITAFVIDGRTATIGFVPPGQALLIQDGRLYGVPDLASWNTGFMPVADQEVSNPLGFTHVVQPLIRTTEIGVNDQFVLGASAVGRVMANRAGSAPTDIAGESVIHRLEEALAESGIDDAYAAWIRCDPAPVSTISSERMAEIERSWRGERTEALLIHTRLEVQTDPKLRRAARMDSFQGKLIETSERLFARKEPECLPLESRRRMATPPGAGSLERYVAPRVIHVTPGLRSLMPRGFRFSIRGIVGLLLAILLIGALILKRDVALGRDTYGGDPLFDAKTEIQLAQAATSPDEANEHLQIARRSLERALSRGEDPAVIAEWRNNVALVADDLNEVNRLGNLVRIGTFPESMSDVAPRVLTADGRLFLVTDGVYEVGAADHQLMNVLRPGQRVQSTEVFPIISATVDSGSLVVSDGRSLFRLDGNGKWSATELNITTSDTASSTISGAFKGSYYLLDTTVSQVKKFSASDLSAAPADWLTEEGTAEFGEPVDLAVDGNIYLLFEDGSIKIFFKGSLKSEHEVLAASSEPKAIGLYRGSSDGDLYVVAVDNGEGSLVRYNRSERESIAYLAPTEMHINFDAAGAEAFAGAVDFVIDENTETLYFVTATGLWQASFS